MLIEISAGKYIKGENVLFVPCSSSFFFFSILEESSLELTFFLLMNKLC